MKRIIEDKSILKPPGLYGVVGGGFVVPVCVFLFVFLCWFTQCKIHKGEGRIPFLVA